MKKEHRFNLALDDEDAALLDHIAKKRKWRKTDVLREALREYGRRQEAPANNPGTLLPLIQDNFGKVMPPTPRPGNIECSGCGKVSVAELNADGIWAYPFALFRYVDGRILCVDCNEKETNSQ